MTTTHHPSEPTPGPWAVSKQKARRVTNAHGVVICNAVLRNQGTAKGGLKHGAKDVLEAEANAALIAAAPELLEALAEITDAFVLRCAGSGVDGELSPVVRKARTALTKARSGDPS